MFQCRICGKQFETFSECNVHEAGHIVRPVSEKPLTVMLSLPDGVTEGKITAAEVFAKGIAELRRKYRWTTFQFVPFTYVNGYLTEMLAIADPDDDAGPL